MKTGEHFAAAEVYQRFSFLTLKAPQRFIIADAPQTWAPNFLYYVTQFFPTFFLPLGLSQSRDLGQS